MKLTKINRNAGEGTCPSACPDAYPNVCPNACPSACPNACPSDTRLARADAVLNPTLRGFKIKMICVTYKE